MSQIGGGDDLSGFSMLELFRMEVEAQTAILVDGLLAAERAPATRDLLDALMRAAHSLKGAARMSDQTAIVRVSHAMEDVFEGAREGRASLTRGHVDVLLRGVDLINHLAQPTLDGGEARDDGALPQEVNDAIDSFLAQLASPPSDTATGVAQQASESDRDREAVPPTPTPAPAPAPASAAPVIAQLSPLEPPPPETDSPARRRTDREGASQTAVRIGAEQFNRLLGLAGEAVAMSRQVSIFVAELNRLQQTQNATLRLIGSAREQAMSTADERTQAAVMSVHESANHCQAAFSLALSDLDAFDRQAIALSHRLYEEVVAARMRPLADGVQGFPRMVRDLAHALGKQVGFTIDGEQTPVDRDILQRLEAPLVHLLRNVVDHGIESPADRVRQGKREEGRVTLAARHSAGKLLVSVEDDGRGVDPERIRARVIEQHLTTPEVAAKLTPAELLEFLFLPGFSTKGGVTEISGRGVGLDIVLAMAREVGGTAEITSRPGEGMRVQMQLPLTLSVVRALIVEISGEGYAIPLSRIARVVRVARSAVQSVEGHQYALIDDHLVGLVSAQHVLALGGAVPSSEELIVVVLGDKATRYGLVVDVLLSERELVVRPLDVRLGKVTNVSAAALLPDATPVLILDVDDMVRSIEIAVSGGRLTPVGIAESKMSTTRRRVLVVDDSITVRETERKLLESAGYQVDVAVDGMDGWNAVRTGHYDLVVTDVDMPRLTGIELTTMIRKDQRLKGLPVMIVSYKDREEDRIRGLDAGADYYLTKASFHDDTLLRATADLIGEGVVTS